MKKYSNYKNKLDWLKRNKKFYKKLLILNSYLQTLTIIKLDEKEVLLKNKNYFALLMRINFNLSANNFLNGL